MTSFQTEASDTSSVTTVPQGVAGKLQPLQELFNLAVPSFGGWPALRFHGRSLSYAEVGRRVEETASVLRRAGAGPGTRIVLLTGNSPATVVYTLAAFTVGATLLALDPASETAILAACLKSHGAQLIIAPDLSPLFDQALAAAALAGDLPVIVTGHTAYLPLAAAAHLRLFSGGLNRVVAGERHHVYPEHQLMRERAGEALLPMATEPRPAALGDAAFCVPGAEDDGGRTTLITHDNLCCNLLQVLAALPRFSGNGDCVVVAAPLWHPLSLMLGLMPAWTCGAEVILVPNMAANTFAETVLRGGVTHVIAPAPLLRALVEAPGATRIALAKLKTVTSCAGVLPQQLQEAFARLSQTQVLDSATLPCGLVFGLTRAARAHEAPHVEALEGSAFAVRDFAAPARELPRGERGTLCVRGPQIPKPSQLLMAEGNAYCDSGLLTGDLATLDATGRLFRADRIADLIVAAGYLIYPRRIEAALLEHSDVLEAAVIGVGDAARGTAPKAFVVLRTGAPVTERDLLRFLAERISRIEMPADIDFCTTLPRTPFGLISKARLRRREAVRKESDQGR